MDKTARRNITLAIDEAVLVRAKVVAARRGVSLSALIRYELQRLAEQDERYESARRSAEERIDDGPFVGAGTLPSRESLHDRDALR